MLFTINNLFRSNTFKLLCCGLAVFSLLSTPILADKKDSIFDAAEYEEWGLDYPGTPSANSGSDEVETQVPVTTQPPQPSQQPQQVPSQLPTAGPVPPELAKVFDQAAVFVIVIYGEDDYTGMPGWIVDAERRIIMTFDLLDGAKQIKVAYPQDQNVPEGEISQSLAKVYEHDAKMSYVFIQADVMPESVANTSILNSSSTQPIAQRPASSQPPFVVNKPTPPTPPTPPSNGGFNGGQNTGGLMGGFNQGGGFNGGQQGGFQQPAQSHNPLIGTWFLQDSVNGTQIRIGAAFDAQGQFALHVITVNGYGQQSQETTQGTYTVQGNTLITRTNEGVEQSTFWFENGMLYVQMNSVGTTLIFQPAS